MIHKTKPNGDCFFECVKIILNKNISCSELRYILAKYLLKHYKKYNLLFLLKLYLSGEAFFEYFKGIQKNDTLSIALEKIYNNIVSEKCWADSLLIQVMSDILKIDFKINNSYFVLDKYPRYALLNYDGSHYDVESKNLNFIFIK